MRHRLSRVRLLEFFLGEPEQLAKEISDLLNNSKNGIDESTVFG